MKIELFLKVFLFVREWRKGKIFISINQFDKLSARMFKMHRPTIHL